MPDPIIEDRRERILLTGDLPSPANPPKGCRFHTRCPWRQETKCDTERPELRVISIDGVPASHRVACHFAEQIAAGELRPHEVKAQLTVQHVHGPGETDFMGPATVTEAMPSPRALRRRLLTRPPRRPVCRVRTLRTRHTCVAGVVR